jgi:hypothetical protein
MEKLKVEGDPCDDDGQCETGFCEAVKGTQKKCLRTCTAGCTALEQCEPLAADGGEDRFGCVPAASGLCRTCDSDSVCPYPGDKCIVLQDEHFCGRDCGFDGTCPLTYSCLMATRLDGGTSPSQCQPTSGTCKCTDKNEGQSMPCDVKNAIGDCVGVQVCKPPQGFTTCSAHVPVPEVCNGVDDDCNGLTDDGLPNLQCGVGDCLRSSASCANGVPVQCMPGMPHMEICDGRDNDCDGVIDNGFNLQTDVANCGSCGHACVVMNAVPDCDGGMCGIAHCLPGWLDRDGIEANGCEFPCTPTNGGVEICDGIDNDCNGIVDDGFNLTSDPLNCGMCNHVCVVGNGTVATYQCVAGICGILTCVPGRANCNQVYSDGCEINTAADLANCGGCGSLCAPPHASAACTNGMCGIVTCLAGYSNCNGLLADGCEVNTTSDVANCGSCGNVCSFANATASCTAGMCGFTCNANWWNVDNISSNGCEYACVKTNNGVEICDHIDNNCNGLVDEGFNTNSDVNNCGSCGHVCSAPFTQVYSCTAGGCGIAMCQSGRADCDGMFSTGCETNIASNLMACGGCGLACNPAHANAQCLNGTCGISSCQAPYRDCNVKVTDGCEVNIQTDPMNCGSCGNVCALANATSTCTAGNCTVVTCAPGHYNLDGIDANGCEYACTPTNGGVEICDGLDNDCNGVIDDGFNLMSDPNNCGTCNRVCSAAHVVSPACVAGNCTVFQCETGWSDCDVSFPDGCEVNTATSLTSCGTCGVPCTTAHATPQCVGGMCQVASCNANFGNCNNMASDGCEANLLTDKNNCGICGRVCTGATPNCINGNCM